MKGAILLFVFQYNSFLFNMEQINGSFCDIHPHQYLSIVMGRGFSKVMIKLNLLLAKFKILFLYFPDIYLGLKLSVPLLHGPNRDDYSSSDPE